MYRKVYFHMALLLRVCFAQCETRLAKSKMNGEKVLQTISDGKNSYEIMNK